MGGTFDPIHFGHLLIAERAREEFGLDRIIFVPTGKPAHKKSYHISSAHRRWDMTCLAIESNPDFEASRVEIDREGTSYAVDTILELSRQNPGLKPYFITGMDAVMEILTWHRAQELPGLTEFVAAARPGYDASVARAQLPPNFLERIHFLTVPLIEISSTVIRQRVGQGLSIRYMAPRSVLEYIETEGLYRK